MALASFPPCMDWALQTRSYLMRCADQDPALAFLARRRQRRPSCALRAAKTRAVAGGIGW